MIDRYSRPEPVRLEENKYRAWLVEILADSMGS